MDTQQILTDITHIVRDVVDDETVQLQPSTTAADVEGWDSLSHIQLVVAIEKHFGVRFTAAEIQQWKNVGEMVAAVQQRKAG